MAAANREEELFLAALEQTTPAAQAAFLDKACANDTPLRRRVAALLRAHAQADSVLDQPALDAGASAARTRTLALSAEATPANPGEPGERTQGEPAGDEQSLSFLAPARTAGSLGRLDHYDVLEVVGQGGMGVVLKARDTTLERIVAIKVLAPQLAASGNARKRFAREAKAAAAVRDEHVVDIHAVHDMGPIPYLVMEYIGGSTLDERIKQGGPLEVKEILRIGFQTACGLAAAHKQGLIHRDIKPANILLENGVQRVKITDFGLARAADDASLTQSGVIAGTPMYMSPEQARGEPVDHRSDLFSLGSVLYTLSTGHPAFRAANTMAVLKRVCEETPRPIREVNPDIPDWLAAIIGKLLAKAPADRFQSAAELAELLSQCLAHVQQPQQNPLPPPVLVYGKRRAGGAARALAAAAAFLLAIGSGVAYWAMRPNDDNIAVIPGPSSLSHEDRLKQPSPFDGRKRDDIAPALLALAGGGDPDQAAAELVAMLGDSRFMLPNGSQRGALAQSPDGKMLAVPCGSDIALFNADTGVLLRTLTGHTDRVYRVVFSPDGQRLASGCDMTDHTACVWDVHKGLKVATYTGHTDAVLSLAFSPDSQRVATGSRKGAVRLWEAGTGVELNATFLGHGGDVVDIAFSPDGAHIVSGGRDNQGLVWDIKTGLSIAELKGHTSEVREIAFSPKTAKEPWLATGSVNELVLWNADTFEKIRTLNTAAGWLAFDPDGTTILAARQDHTNGTAHAVTRWNLATDEKVDLRLQGSGNYARYRLSPDGKTLFATRIDPDVPYVRVYDAVTGKERFARQQHEGMVYSVAMHPDGKLLASGGADRAVKLWDLAGWKAGAPLPPMRTLHEEVDAITCIVFSPDGNLLAWTSGDHPNGTGTVVLWDAVRGETIATFAPVASHILRLAFSPDGKTLAAGCNDGAVRMWDVASKQQKALQFNHTGQVRCVAFSPDGKQLASGGEDRSVQLTDVATGQRVRAIASLPAIVNNLAFSPDGQTLAAVCDRPQLGTGGTLHLWDIDTWTKRTLPAHTDHIHGLEFCPAAPLLATGSYDGILRYWDPTTTSPRNVSIGPGPFGGPVHLTFTPEGRYLVTGNGNGTISVLRVPVPPAALAPPIQPIPPIPPIAPIAPIPPIAPIAPARSSPNALPDPVELAKRASAADALRRDGIPPELLQRAAAAAGGEAPRELVAVLPHGPKQILAVAISGDGKLLASCSDDQTAKIWELATGKLLHTLTHKTCVCDVAFVPRRGKGAGPSLLLATAGAPSLTAMLWDANTGELVHTLSGHTNDVVLHMAASPDGRWFASSDASGTIHVWDPATGKRLRTLSNPRLGYGDLAASPDGRLLAAAGEDGAVRLWDPISGWLRGTLVGHKGPARAVAFLPDGRTLASSGQTDRTIRLWDLATLREKQVLDGIESSSVELACRADGRLLAADDSGVGKVRFWDLSSDPPRSAAIRLFPAPVRFLHAIAMTPEGRYLATANPDGTVYVLRLAERGVVYTVP